jgi:hypothetical protein
MKHENPTIDASYFRGASTRKPSAHLSVELWRRWIAPARNANSALAWFASCFLSAMLLAAMAAPCRGQDTALVQPSLGVLPRSPAIESERAKTKCPPILGDHRDHLLAASVPQDSTRMTCSVERVDSLHQAVGLQWRVVKYVTLYVFPADSLKRRFQAGATTDTSEVLDVVIYSAEGGDSRWRAEWRGWAERAMIRDVDVSLGAHSGLRRKSPLEGCRGRQQPSRHHTTLLQRRRELLRVTQSSPDAQTRRIERRRREREGVSRRQPLKDIDHLLTFATDLL